MDPVTITFPGFRNLCAGKFSKTPLSTDCVIVFPLNRRNKFSRTLYSAAMTQGRASLDDVNQVFTLLEFILVRLQSKLSLLMSLILRFFLPFMVLLCYHEKRWYDSNYNNDYDSYYSSSRYRSGGFRYTSFDERIWAWFAFYCVAGIGYMLFDRRRQMKQVKADIEEVIKMVQPGYVERGLRWRVPDESYGWIELIKEYHQEAEPSAPVVVQVHSGAKAGEKVKSLYEPLNEVSQETEISISYPPIETYELSAPQQ